MKLAWIPSGTIALCFLAGCGNGSSQGTGSDDSGPAPDVTTIDVTQGPDAPQTFDSPSGDAPTDAGDAGSSCSSGDAGTGPIARADFATTFAEAICSAIAGCCGQVSYPYDPVACRALQVQNWNAQAQSNEQMGYTYDPQAARDCLTATAGELCTCDENRLTEAQDNARTAACSGMFAGHIDAGGACTFDQDCTQQPGMIAVCAGMEGPIDAGIPGITVYECVGSVCEYIPPGSPDEEVDPHGSVGEACGGTCSWSVESTFCQLISLATEIGCHGGLKGCFLGDGVYCNPDTMKCTAVPSEAGADCSFLGPDGGYVGSGEVNCAGNLYCQHTGSADASSYACAPANAHAPCDPNAPFSVCGGTAYCDDTAPDGGTLADGGAQCAPLKANGQPCAAATECQSSTCVPRYGVVDGGSICQIPPFEIDPVACSGNPEAGMAPMLRRHDERPSRALDRMLGGAGPGSLRLREPKRRVAGFP